jgi:hypothetical protein
MTTRKERQILRNYDTSEFDEGVNIFQIKSKYSDI